MSFIPGAPPPPGGASVAVVDNVTHLGRSSSHGPDWLHLPGLLHEESDRVQRPWGAMLSVLTFHFASHDFGEHMTGMPSYPGDSAPMGSPLGPPQVPAPAEVLTAVKLWFASILVGLLGGILVYVLTDKNAALQKAMASNRSGLSRADLQTVVNVGLVIGLFVGLVMLGLEVFFVLKMRAGRNWARIVLTVLGALSALSSLAGLAKGFSLGSAVNLISLLLTIAALAFMFRPAAAQYFKRPRA